jgi:branched-chain amino acid aminotransferase
MRVWFNGQFLDDPSRPVIGVADHGFTVGDGVFEAVKTVQGVPFALNRHLERLSRSARGLGLPEPDLDAVRRGVAAVLDATPDPLGRLRITFTAGAAPMGSGRGGGPETLVVAYSAMQPAAESAVIVTVPWTRNEHAATAGLKTTSYADNVVALAHAHERGADEAVFANTTGNLCEGTGSNLFYVVDDELRTPSLDSGCLAGVTRALVLEWSGAREVDEPLDQVRAVASEAFLVSTTRDVQPVRLWDDRVLPAPGPHTRRCADTWAARAPETMEP